LIKKNNYFTKVRSLKFAANYQIKEYFLGMSDVLKIKIKDRDGIVHEVDAPTD